MASESEVAWAAGLFEGEGCFTLSAGYPRAKLNSVDEETVRAFHSIVEVGQVREDRAPVRRGWQPQWEWYTGKRASVEQLVRLLGPWLGTRRRARAAEILARN